MALTLAIYVLAAVAEIGSCFSVWKWLRGDGSTLWLAPAMVGLAAFSVLLTRVDVAFAGRAFAAYGGIYIATSLAWLALVEHVGLTRWDAAGVALCLLGAMLIVIGPKLG